MCGRYYIDQEEDLAEMRQILEEVNRRFHDSLALSAMRAGEITPSQVVPVLRPEQRQPDSRIVPDLMQWGFPQYQGSGLIINARSESALVKPMFKSAVKTGRILVPASAFFEWEHLPQANLPQARLPQARLPQARKGRKMTLSMTDEPIFYMAGLARYFQNIPGSTMDLWRFVILTTSANASVAPIHDRMPLILPRRLLRRWLLDDQAAEEFLQQPVDMQMVLTETA